MRTSRSIAIVMLAIVAMLSFGGASSFAQTASPTPSPTAPPPTPTQPPPTPSPTAQPSPSPTVAPPTAPPVSTPVPATPMSGQGAPLPIAIFQGTCESSSPQAEVALSNTTVAGAGAEEGQIIGQNPGPPALVSISAVDQPLADLAQTPRVIQVHQGPELGTVVACGNIAGTVVEDQMVIALQPVGDTGVSGIALLNQVEDQTNVVTYVVSPNAVPATPAP